MAASVERLSQRGAAINQPRSGGDAMARYAILNTVDWQGCRSLASGEVAEEEVMQRLTGCAWLFRVSDGVDSVEDAARAAVRSFFSSTEGRNVARREEVRALSWAEAMAWVTDEVWERHGLEPICHPEFERVILDAAEDLGPPAS
jgi:hypothetical protein